MKKIIIAGIFFCASYAHAQKYAVHGSPEPNLLTSALVNFSSDTVQRAKQECFYHLSQKIVEQPDLFDDTNSDGSNPKWSCENKRPTPQADLVIAAIRSQKPERAGVWLDSLGRSKIEYRFEKLKDFSDQPISFVIAATTDYKFEMLANTFNDKKYIKVTCSLVPAQKTTINLGQPYNSQDLKIYDMHDLRNVVYDYRSTEYLSYSKHAKAQQRQLAFLPELDQPTLQYDLGDTQRTKSGSSEPELDFEGNLSVNVFKEYATNNLFLYQKGDIFELDEGQARFGAYEFYYFKIPSNFWISKGLTGRYATASCPSYRTNTFGSHGFTNRSLNRIVRKAAYPNYSFYMDMNQE